MNGAIRARVHGAGARGDAVHACRSNLPWGHRPLCYYSELNFGEVDMVFSEAERGGGTATLRIFGAERSSRDEDAKIAATVVASSLQAEAQGQGAALLLPRDTFLACAHPPLHSPGGLSQECLEVLGPLAHAAALPSYASLALHLLVAGGLTLAGVGALGIAPLLFLVATGRASAAVEKRLSLSPLPAHALVGAVLAVYCAATGGVALSVLEQLLI